jgi:hypothetical protein
MTISQETYQEMKRLIQEFESNPITNPNVDNQPYIITTTVEVITERKYNPKFGDNRICECGHPYYRHFDTYDDMEACGCKYCDCFGFEEKDK